MLKSREVAMMGRAWKVGNGKTVRFWEDLRLSLGPLYNNSDFVPFMEDCKATFGVFVAD